MPNQYRPGKLSGQGGSSSKSMADRTVRDGDARARQLRMAIKRLEHLNRKNQTALRVRKKKKAATALR